MTRIVRCPECGTVYTLVPDQLKIAQAWLRCGQCQHAFDSTGLVVAWPALIERETVDSVGIAERLVIDELLKQEDRSDPSVQPETALSAFEEALTTFKPEPLTPLLNEAMLGGLGEKVHPQPDAGHPERNSLPALKRSSWLLKLSVLVLLLALAFQWLWIERHALVAAEPSVAKVGQAVCRTWGCAISPLQVRDGIVIESSSLMPQEEGGFLLRWSWRNARSQTLQTPALELTLLNAQDKALVRRVMPVAELGAPVSLATGQTWDGQLHLMPEEGLMPSGYRLLSFYP